jgi:hypothetical protein
MSEIKLNIPENISDITLGQYQKYNKLSERTDLNEYDFSKRLLEIFCGIKYHDIDKIGLTDFTEVINMIKLAINQDSEFVNRFYIDDVEFGFIPNLDKMTASEYFDISTVGLEVDSLHKLMAILFRPVKKKDAFGNYNIYSYNGTADYEDIMLRTPMNVVNGALVFFSSLAKELKTAILKYTEAQQEKVNKLQTTSKSGDGM